MAKVTRITQEDETPFAFLPAMYPDRPGCYLMRNGDGDVIYVGKANGLRSRLASYFRSSAAPHRKAEMLSRVRRIDVILVRNEREALVLESNLIRHLQPAYNSRFTHDDDSYYYIALTDEAFPRFVPYRKRRTNFALTSDDDVRALFGPYVGWRLRNRILEAVRATFPVRTCHSIGGERPCSRGEAGRCGAPCDGSTSAWEYERVVSSACRFLARPSKARRRSLRRQMEAAARAREFERARDLRDRLLALEHASLPQAVERHRRFALDVLYIEGDQAVRMPVREGAVVGLDGPHTVDPSPSGVRELVDDILPDGPPGKLLVSGAVDWRPLARRLPLRVSTPGTSYSGQLLEICRMNLTYRLIAQGDRSAPAVGRRP
jgi:excinuclease ABC subunit C